MNILAGAITRYQYDPTTGSLVAEGGEQHESKGPTFAIRTLNYFESQKLYDSEDPIEQMRTLITLGLVDIDGDADKAAQFIEQPRVALWVAAFDAIKLDSWGN